MKTAQEKLNFYAARHARQRQRAENSPQDQAASFFASVYGQYVEEAEDERIIEQRARAGELIELRFMGERANGRLPLRALLDAVDPFERGMAHAAHRLHTGETARQPVQSVRDLLGLEFAGLEHGSTRVLVLGDSRADLTGVNLFEATATQVFRFLNAKGDDFYDAADAIGGQAARCIDDLLKETSGHGMTLEMSCQRDLLPWLSWRGTTDEIDRVRRLIETTQEPEVYEETLEGVVAALSDAGSITLRIGDEKRSVRFPLKLIKQAQQLTIAQPAKLRVLTSRYYDSVFKRDVYKHTLIG